MAVYTDVGDAELEEFLAEFQRVMAEKLAQSPA